MEVNPACVEIGQVPSLSYSLNFPTFNLPQRPKAANALIRFTAQLPAMEFMASKPFTLTQQQAVGSSLQLSVAHLQPSSFGFKRQETSHRMQCSVRICQAST